MTDVAFFGLHVVDLVGIVDDEAPLFVVTGRAQIAVPAMTLCFSADDLLLYDLLLPEGFLLLVKDVKQSFLPAGYLIDGQPQFPGCVVKMCDAGGFIPTILRSGQPFRYSSAAFLASR